ncbi:MAG: hypothetical protein ACM3RX_05230 [Methanococcaceae archaeon]
MHRFFGIIMLLSGLMFTSSYGQNSFSWITVSANQSRRLKLDVSTIKQADSSDIYVWALESFAKPVNIENITKGIQKIKTYYIMNRELKKYSIIEIVYYGAGNRRLKDYHYKQSSAAAAFKYNSPILPNTDVEAVFKKCFEYIQIKK